MSSRILPANFFATRQPDGAPLKPGFGLSGDLQQALLTSCRGVLDVITTPDEASFGARMPRPSDFNYSRLFFALAYPALLNRANDMTLVNGT